MPLLDHLEFATPNLDAMAAFAMALSAGGIEPRAPKLLPQIEPDYYAAFIRDPDGHVVEFVCRAAETAA